MGERKNVLVAVGSVGPVGRTKTGRRGADGGDGTERTTGVVRVIMDCIMSNKQPKQQRKYHLYISQDKLNMGHHLSTQSTPAPAPAPALPTFTVIAAYHSPTRGIGTQGRLPWHVLADMKYFRDTTQTTRDPRKRNALIMGRRTLESFHGRLLPGRFHMCLTRQPPPKEGPPKELSYASSLDHALKLLGNMSDVETIFVIGGEQVYQEALQHPQCERILVNELVWVPESHMPFARDDLDAFFPEIPIQMYQEERIEIQIKTYPEYTISITNRIYHHRHHRPHDLISDRTQLSF